MPVRVTEEQLALLTSGTASNARVTELQFALLSSGVSYGRVTEVQLAVLAPMPTTFLQAVAGTITPTGTLVGAVLSGSSTTLSGVITPDGWVPLMVVEGDNPGGTTTPFGTLTWEANFQASAPDLVGVITPEGDLEIADNTQCQPANYECVADPVPNTVEIDVCEPIEIPPPIPGPAAFEGTIIPVGTLEIVVLPPPPVTCNNIETFEEYTDSVDLGTVYALVDPHSSVGVTAGLSVGGGSDGGQCAFFQLPISTSILNGGPRYRRTVNVVAGRTYTLTGDIKGFPGCYQAGVGGDPAFPGAYSDGPLGLKLTKIGDGNQSNTGICTTVAQSNWEVGVSVTQTSGATTQMYVEFGWVGLGQGSTDTTRTAYFDNLKMQDEFGNFIDLCAPLTLCERSDGTDTMDYLNDIELSNFWVLNKHTDAAATMTLDETIGNPDPALRLDNGPGFSFHSGPRMELLVVDPFIPATPTVKTYVLSYDIKLSSNIAQGSSCEDVLHMIGPMLADLTSGSSYHGYFWDATARNGSWNHLVHTASMSFTGGSVLLTFGWGDIAFFTACVGSIWLDNVRLMIDGRVIQLCHGTRIEDPCDFGNLIAGELNTLSDITDQGWIFTGPGPSVNGVTSIVIDGGSKAIAMEVTVHGGLSGSGAYYLEKDFTGLNPAAQYYAEILMRKVEVLSFLSETGLNLEGNGNYHNIVGDGLSGYVVVQSQVVNGFLDGTMKVAFGSFGVQNGDQNHHEIYYLRYIKLIQVGCS